MLDGAKERPTNWGHKESLSLSHKLGNNYLTTPSVLPSAPGGTQAMD